MNTTTELLTTDLNATVTENEILENEGMTQEEVSTEQELQKSALRFVSIDNDKVGFMSSKGTKVYWKPLKGEDTFVDSGTTYKIVDGEIYILGGIELVSAIKRSIPTVNPFKPLQSEFPINQRFDFLKRFANMVIEGTLPSAIVSGEGGLGKSHTVMDALAAKGLVEGDDYVVIKGFATPKALYGTLYDHNDKVIVFDDCDSVLKDPTSINILKGALDSYAKRTISWLSKGFIEDEYPSSFEFTGQVIFISNINSVNLDQAVKSRSITIDLSMTIQDKIERMQHLLPTILPEYSMDIKEAALAFMANHSNEAREFNIRTLMKSVKVIAAYGLENIEWEAAVKYLLISV